MATTNLISKSLGDILTESGNGTPDHSSPKGSLYVDKDTAVVYQNIDGGSIWQKLNTVAYGEGYYQDNTNVTTISATNTWTAVGNTFTEGANVGFSGNTDTLVLINGYDGDYQVKGHATISYVAGTNNYEIGLSVNGTNPTSGTYNGALVNGTFTRQNISFDTIVSLTGGNSLEFAVRNLTNSDNIIIRHASLMARKVG